MTHILDFDEHLFKIWLTEKNHPPYRARQIIQWVHQKRVLDTEAMHTLPKTLRADLAECFKNTQPSLISERVANDGTVKWLMVMGGGNAIETVFIPEKNRGTLCVSSQIGCALACTFCLTGDQGFHRSLSTSEILLQLHTAYNRLQALGYSGEKIITNIVFMGMGEPLTNEAHLYPALALLLSDYAYGLSKYRVTVSTSGIVPAMYRLKEASACALAVSLHAANDALRSTIMPINNKYNLEDLHAACKSYFNSESKRGIVFEYIMLDGINDHIHHAHELILWLRNIPHAKVNLIPFNEYPGGRFKTSPKATILAFQQLLKKHGILTTIRKTRGENILAACGQLAGKVMPRVQRTSQNKE